MKPIKMIIALAAGLACGAQATPITFTFLENGTGSLGHSATFTEAGVSIIATASPGEDLWGKNEGGDENGLGIASESDHEIDASSFIQLTIPTTTGVTLKSISLGSVQPGELAKIYLSNALGDLGTQIGTVSSDGTVDLSGLPASGFVDIAGGGTPGGNVLLNTLVVDFTVPDGGTTVALLGCGLTLLGATRRKLALR